MQRASGPRGLGTSGRSAGGLACRSADGPSATKHSFTLPRGAWLHSTLGSPEAHEAPGAEYHAGVNTRRLGTVLFDWDGTILDSAEATYRTYRTLFSEYGYAFDRRRFEETYSPDWYRTYVALGIDESLWKKINDRWMEIYSQESCDLVPGAVEAVARLREAGSRLGVVTSGSRDRVKRQIEDLGLGRTFSVVICSEDVEKRKPDPEGLEIALARMGAAAGGSCYVGDSPEDVRMARAAGVFSVAVPGGFPNRAELIEASADLFAESLEEAVAQMMNGQ